MPEGKQMTVLSSALEVNNRATDLRTKLYNVFAFLEPQGPSTAECASPQAPNNPASILNDARLALVEAETLLSKIAEHLGA